jgi:phospholipase C
VRGNRHVASLAIVVVAVAAGSLWAAAPGAARSRFSTPIQHVVVIFQENHSFDNVFGPLCVQDHRCNGVATGVLPNGTRIPLKRAADLVPDVGHSAGAQTTAINGGAMNGYAHLRGCEATTRYRCYTAYRPDQIPNLAALARAFVISDQTFETSRIGSWGSHIALVASDPDGFVGDPEKGQSSHKGKGGGCDSYKDALWQAPEGGDALLVPSCIPDLAGNGPYRPSPVQYVPTIIDRMTAAGLSWKLYAADGPDAQGGGTGYVWAVCPTFAECLFSEQKDDFVPSGDVLADAADGTLPNLTLIVPNPPHSQHNDQSMLEGDNWIGSIVDRIEHSPQWDSTAIFITYDDCGCFYDHVLPPSYAGIREPMVIVSPYAKAGYTDSHVTTFNGMLAYVEHVFDVPPLSDADAFAYDFSNSFDYTQRPRTGIPMVTSPVPKWELDWMKAHPQDEDDIT